MEDEIVEVATFRMLHEAELAATTLRQAGIECTVPDRFGWGLTPEGVFTGYNFRVLVRAAERERALAVLGLRAVTKA